MTRCSDRCSLCAVRYVRVPKSFSSSWCHPLRHHRYVFVTTGTWLDLSACLFKLAFQYKPVSDMLITNWVFQRLYLEAKSRVGTALASGWGWSRTHDWSVEVIFNVYYLSVDRAPQDWLCIGFLSLEDEIRFRILLWKIRFRILLWNWSSLGSSSAIRYVYSSVLTTHLSDVTHLFVSHLKTNLFRPGWLSC